MDLLNLPSAKELLNKSAYFDEYSDGETPWGSDYPSFEEGPLSGAFKLAGNVEALSTP